MKVVIDGVEYEPGHVKGKVCNVIINGVHLVPVATFHKGDRVTINFIGIKGTQVTGDFPWTVEEDEANDLVKVSYIFHKSYLTKVS